MQDVFQLIQSLPRGWTRILLTYIYPHQCFCGLRGEVGSCNVQCIPATKLRTGAHNKSWIRREMKKDQLIRPFQLLHTALYTFHVLLMKLSSPALFPGSSTLSRCGEPKNKFITLMVLASAEKGCHGVRVQSDILNNAQHNLLKFTDPFTKSVYVIVIVCVFNLPTTTTLPSFLCSERQLTWVLFG